ncbi:hypothetical protein GCM10027429_05660 [Marivirga atlantica]|uniref:Tetratricopeptide repeat protein n=1 Tax=Marivirga atlantica TaxID=1548457 RepID=A0A937A8I3_9BACT|nr:tetratricopeptide repeat protein [Marivirga atlantica]MBL0764175.1 tetratricopeptide repeat protein [Marivirga atlantica]
MLRSRIILLVISIVLIAVIFSLPKIVVDNEEDTLDTKTSDIEATSEHMESSPASEEEVHDNKLSAELAAKAQDLRNKLEGASTKEKSSIFADSLAALYSSVNKLDSAAKYVELSATDKELIGDAYYEAFTFAVSPEKANSLGEKVRKYYAEILEEDASRLDLKTKIAMTYVSSENPMSGIMMLREVIEQEPTNEEALFNLGILSIQSGQYDKAIGRFETLLANHPKNEQAEFYLALSYFNDNRPEDARRLFQKIKNTSKDEQVLAAVESYLNEL